jgi:hypothetical protein
MVGAVGAEPAVREAVAATEVTVVQWEWDMAQA